MNKKIETKEEKKPTRKDSPPIKVYCLPEEKKLIEANARATGLSVSTFLLRIGMGYQVTGIVDYEQVRELSRINGDLGRLGGLLKLWLSNDQRTAKFGEGTIRELLSQIEDTQRLMGEVALKVVMPRKSS
ncbi:MAG: conjugal transfer transcriptional regulator TraJ [Methylococcales bacterium]|nr:conjugal transfer transcriptional regulator TraJ [Methylococcales bacterium]